VSLRPTQLSLSKSSGRLSLSKSSSLLDPSRKNFLGQKIFNNVKVYCLLIRLTNLRKITIASIQRGELGLDIMMIQKQTNLTLSGLRKKKNNKFRKKELGRPIQVFGLAQPIRSSGLLDPYRLFGTDHPSRRVDSSYLGRQVRSTHQGRQACHVYIGRRA